MSQNVDKRCVAQKPISLPYFCLLFSFPLVPSCFQNSTLDCKLAAAGAGDKSFDKSPTKTRQPRKVDLRARYWAFLFDNLRRAVDEIYVTCESDQSVVECKVRLQLFLAYLIPIWLFSYFTKTLNEELELQKHVISSFGFCVGFSIGKQRAYVFTFKKMLSS